jgi:hypothetical protein
LYLAESRNQEQFSIPSKASTKQIRQQNKFNPVKSFETETTKRLQQHSIVVEILENKSIAHYIGVREEVEVLSREEADSSTGP